MNKIILSRAIVILLLTGLLVSLINLDANQPVKVKGQQGGPNIFEADVPVRGTYVFADNNVTEWDDNGDGVTEEHYLENPLIVDLAANGFKPGDLILINGRASIYYAANGDRSLYHYGPNTLWGVFSSSNTVLWERQGNEVGPLNRVPGAISAGEPFVSSSTFNGYPTDIPEDFYVNASAEVGTIVRIPLGAAYLMFSVSSGYFTDNDGWTKVTIDKDTDGDSLWDSWEISGVDMDKDGYVDLILEGANWNQKDVYVEVDYMDGHRLSGVAKDDVVAAFRSCPRSVEYGPINVHIEIDDSEPLAIAHGDVVRIWEYFDRIKETYFGTLPQQTDPRAEVILLAKKYTYHYCLFVHGIETWNGTHWNTGAGGKGEVYGNDFVVALGIGFAGSPAEQAATFMHELGHNLGLRHGGGDTVNYKSNYLSIMNYLFEFDGDPLHNRPLTFSSAKLASLNEGDLNEIVGVRGANWDWTVHSGILQTSSGTKYVPLADPTLGNIDWDNDGDDTEKSVKANVNNYPQWGYPSVENERLDGYDDWSNLLFDFQGNENFAAGVHTSALSKDEITEELTWEIVQAMQEDAKSIVGGPTGPVQILDVPDEPSPQEQDTSSPIDFTLIAIVAFVVIVAVAAVALLVLRKRKKQPAP